MIRRSLPVVQSCSMAQGQPVLLVREVVDRPLSGRAQTDIVRGQWLQAYLEGKVIKQPIGNFWIVRMAPSNCSNSRGKLLSLRSSIPISRLFRLLEIG